MMGWRCSHIDRGKQPTNQPRFGGLLECRGPWPGTDRLPLFTIHFVASNFEEVTRSSLQHSIIQGADQVYDRGVRAVIAHPQLLVWVTSEW